MLDRWREHALEKPDKAGVHTPDAVVQRRRLMIETFVLLGRNHTETTRYLNDICGLSLSRQAMKRQLEKAATVADAENLVFPVLWPRSHSETVGGSGRSSKPRQHLLEGGA